MEIRFERNTDAAAVLEVNVRAFGDHGAMVAGLLDPLRELIAEHGGFSLVAVEKSELVGHLMFSRALLDAPRRLVEVQVLSPLAVLPDHQRNGIGSTLVRRGLELAAGNDVPLVFLEGDPGYYSRLGFTAGADSGFRRPSLRIPQPAFQVIKLGPYADWMTGTLVYPALFWEHDAVGLRDPNA